MAPGGTTALKAKAAGYIQRKNPGHQQLAVGLAFDRDCGVVGGKKAGFAVVGLPDKKALHLCHKYLLTPLSLTRA